MGEYNNIGLVSVIMPVYNSEKFLEVATNSVINQTYKNWELILIDDCSTDTTQIIISHLQSRDSRIRSARLESNSGAAIARNEAVKLAKGQYLAFLDSDDYWYPKKLSKQIEFMKNNGYYFSCTNYDKINENGESLNQVIKVIKREYNYMDILKNNPGNSTVIYDANKIGKVYIPDIKKRNDYVMWLSVIKKTDALYGLDETLASHRVRKGSLSYKKIELVKYQWHVYRKIERLSLMMSTYLIVYMFLKIISRKFNKSK